MTEPETDYIEKNLGNAAHPILSAFCRKLERERDEALADLEFRRDLYKLQSERLEGIERERDELRNALSLAGKLCHEVHHPKSMQHGDLDSCPVEAFIQQALYKKP